MDLTVDHSNEYLNENNIFLCKPIRSNLKICLVCLENEIIIENGELVIWDRYEFKCGHQVHTRCGRRWFFIKKCVNCPLCGIIDDTSKNNYCSYCKIFGHYDYNCSKTKQFIQEN